MHNLLVTSPIPALLVSLFGYLLLV